MTNKWLGTMFPPTAAFAGPSLECSAHRGFILVDRGGVEEATSCKSNMVKRPWFHYSMDRFKGKFTGKPHI